jgi:hypothetical protein
MQKWLFSLWICTLAYGSPFTLDIKPQENLQEGDWVQIQSELKTLEISKVLDPIYPKNLSSKKTWFTKPQLKKKSDFLGRISRGVRQTLIDPKNGKFPKKTLLSINGGGDCCVVSFASYNGPYAKELETIPKELEQVGFQGHFLLMTGGFPNPTGKEITYAAVPYCFKIFALLEAKKLGFKKVLWIDATMQPLQNLKVLFEEIEKKGYFFQLKKNGKRYLLPSTRDVLLTETGIDMYKTPSIRAQVFGFDLENAHIQTLIQEYYRLVELGTPFLSCFPEEHVLGALVAKDNYFKQNLFPHLVRIGKKSSRKEASWAKEEGYFFFLKQH